jgi:hypothetical protein
VEVKIKDKTEKFGPGTEDLFPVILIAAVQEEVSYVSCCKK